MVYPRQIDWQHGSSPQSSARLSQRALVEASLLRVGPRSGRRWDERTRTAYKTRTR